MEFLNVVRDNWFDLIQSLFIVASFWLARISFKEETRQRRVANRLEITKQHREIWMVRFSHPELARIGDSSVDLKAKPITPEEKLFVRLLILHLAGCYRTAKAEMFKLPDEITSDVANFFSRPIARAVWEEVRRFQNSDFVRFVEERI